jgi:hypothetical protein
VNLPFVAIDPSPWWATYAFHSQRGPNFDNMWQLVFPASSPAALNATTTLLIGLSFVIALGVAARRSRDGAFPGFAVCGAMLAAFMLWNKVHSPQYTLWLLPFFVLVRVHIGWWVAYAVADLAVYVGVFRWFYDFVYLGHDFTFAKRLMIGGIWARAALLALLFVVFLRTRETDPPPPAPAREPSEPHDPSPKPVTIPVTPSG